MSVEIIPQWHLSPADDRRIAALLKQCFTTDFGDRSYFIQPPQIRLILRDQGQITAHMALTLRAVRLGGTLVDIVGLCDVATAPEQRGRGHAAKLLQAALAQARLSQARHFLLFGTAGLYAAAGFAQAHNPVTYVDMTGAHTGATRTEPAEHLMVLPLAEMPWDSAAPLDLLGPLF